MRRAYLVRSGDGFVRDSGTLEMVRGRDATFHACRMPWQLAENVCGQVLLKDFDAHIVAIQLVPLLPPETGGYPVSVDPQENGGAVGQTVGRRCNPPSEGR